MDRIKRRRRKGKKPKKLLLSTVDPWDVRVASIEPVTLAQRRGTSLSSLSISSPNGSKLSPNSPTTSTPSPWYKPSNSPRPQSPENLDNDQGSALTSPEWPLPWYKPLRSPTTENFRDSTQSVPPLKPPRSRSNSNVKIGGSDSVDEGIERNIKKFLGNNEKDPGVVNVPIIEVHFVNEKRVNGVQFRDYDKEEGFNDVPEIVISEPETPDRLNSKIINNNNNNNNNDNNNYEEKKLLINGVESIESKENHNQTEFKHSIETIVEDLVKARYSPQTARQRRLNRSSSRSPLADEDDLRIEFDKSPSETINDKIGRKEEIKSPLRKLSDSMPDRLENMNESNQNIRQQGTSSRFQRDDSDSSATFSNSGSTPRGTPLDSDTDDDVNDEELAKVPLQTPPRRKGATIVPMSSGQKQNKEALETPGGQSTHSTITSVNSISSLLKEKLQLSLPQALRSSKKQQNADYRLRAFVGILFLSIVFLVGFAYIYYNKNVLQRAYFEQFRFNKNDRVMHIYSKTGSEMIAARLGEGIIPEAGVFPCLPHHEKPGVVCLEWLQQTRLYMSHTNHDDMQCYHVTWQSLTPNYNPKDCFDWSPTRGHWYGAGQTRNMAYPLEEGTSVLESSAFVTGDIKKSAFGNVLKRYFLNSKGATISIDPETPLYISINENKSKDFCIQAKHDSFAYINHLTPLPQLNYTVCASDNMKTLHSLMTEKSLWDGLNKEDSDTVSSLLTEPVWQIPLTNETVIQNYTQAVTDLGFMQGHVLLNEDWQPSSGDFDLDNKTYPWMYGTVDMIRRRGFKVVYSVQPFVSTESINFKEAVASRLLISERGSDPRIPALTRYKQSNSAAMLDITNNRTIPWLQKKLDGLIEKYKIDSFYLDLGNSYEMPHYYKCKKPLINPDHYKTLFTQAMISLVPVIGVSGAISRPKAPVFVSLPPFSSSWKAIKTVIPTVLSYGIIGYPFIMPGAVGGDIALPMSDNNPNNDFQVNLPDKELYVRWLQLSTFLPVIRFTHLPNKYPDDSVLVMAKRLTTLRQKIVTPRLLKYAFEALETGLPIIRPLWMLDPSDPSCHTVADQFSIGDEIIVAPILYSGSRQREVYLPAGVWRDGIGRSLRKGSRWIHNYRVSEDEVAYFVKMPNNTRF